MQTQFSQFTINYIFSPSNFIIKYANSIFSISRLPRSLLLMNFSSKKNRSAIMDYATNDLRHFPLGDICLANKFERLH